MSIDTQIIVKLREQTGAGIGDCKKALEEAGGDLNRAIEILRQSGEIKAAKKADRDANEGVIAIALGENKIAAVVLNCETDFVARNQDFIATANDFAKKLLAIGPEEFKTWAEGVIKNELVVKIGENIKLGQAEILTGEIIGAYLHSNKKVAALVVLEGLPPARAGGAQAGGDRQLANEIAMQVAAMNPSYLNAEAVPAQILAKEKEIYREQLKQRGKPENIWAKIIDGKLAKFYEDHCLVNQIFIKDEAKKISDLLAGAQIKQFRRYQV